jgi:hypothetical protein
MDNELTNWRCSQWRQPSGVDHLAAVETKTQLSLSFWSKNTPKFKAKNGPLAANSIKKWFP